MQPITPFLWYSREAEEAAALVNEIFPDARVTRVRSLASDSPGGPAGSGKIVELMLFGQARTAMSAGPPDPFKHAVSFVAKGRDQAELDRLQDCDDLLHREPASRRGHLPSHRVGSRKPTLAMDRSGENASEA